MAGFFERLRAAVAREQSAALSTYDDLVGRLAEEDESGDSDADVRDLLQRSGKTLADLEADVARRKDRTKWADEAAAGQEAQVELRMLRRSIVELETAQEQERELLKQSQTAAMESLTTKAAKLSAAVNRGNSAAEQLRQTADSALIGDLRSAIKSKPVTKSREGAISARAEANRLAEVARKYAEKADQDARFEDNAKSAADVARGAERRAVIAEQRLADELSERAAAEDEIATLKSQVLVP